MQGGETVVYELSSLQRQIKKLKQWWVGGLSCLLLMRGRWARYIVMMEWWVGIPEMGRVWGKYASPDRDGHLQPKGKTH